MKYKYINEDRMIRLEDSIKFLSDLLPEQGVEYIVGNNSNFEERDIEKSEMIQKLALLNQEREELIKRLTNK